MQIDSENLPSERMPTAVSGAKLEISENLEFIMIDVRL